MIFSLDEQKQLLMLLMKFLKIILFESRLNSSSVIMINGKSMFWVCISKYLPVPLTELFVVERTVCVQVDLFMLTHTGCKIAVTISTGFNIRWNRFSI